MSDTTTKPVVYAFGEFELDTSLYQLRAGGDLVKVEPKVFDVLVYLVEHRDRVVSKDELLDALWPGSISESVLPRCVTAARKALGDDTSGQNIIQTVRGRGYRFVARVNETTSSNEPSTPRPPPPADEQRSVFVGRDAPMRELRGALADAFAGRGRLIVLVGEPGIGKTRICTELSKEAATRGAIVFGGRGYDGEGAPALWPWVQILRAAMEHPQARAAAEELGAAGADLARLAPELGPSGTDTPPPVSPDQAQFRVFDAVAVFLRAIALIRPLLVVLDDLHWADRASLLLARHVARTMHDRRLLVVGTYRDVDVERDPELAAAFADLGREPIHRRIELGGLEKTDIARFVKATTGTTPSTSVVDTVHHMTDGNPFFVAETVRLLAEDGRLETVAAAGVGLPQGVREAIGRRFHALSDECKEVLSVASVIGRSFVPKVVEAATEIDGDRLLDVLDEAASARILEEVDGVPGAYSFAHALTRETLYEELSTPRRVRLHRRVATVLEELYGNDPREHLAELAHHFYQASPGGDVDKAVDYSVLAGKRSHELSAFEESTDHYTRALEALDVRVPADDVRRCHILLSLGESLSRSGERRRARDTFGRAAALARGLKRWELFADAALGFGERAEFAMPRDETLLALLEEAKSCLGTDAPGRRCRILSRLAVSAPYAESLEKRRQLSSEALALARAGSDDSALACALDARAWALLGPDETHARIRLADELLRVAERIGDKKMAYRSLELRSAARMTLGDREGSDRDLDAIAELAKELREPVDRWYWGWFIASRALTDGRFDEADRLIQAGLAAGEQVEHPGATLLAGGQALWLALERGQYDAFVQGLATLVPHYSWADRLSRIASAYRCAMTGNLDAARSELDDLAAHGFDDIPRDEHWLVVMGQLAHTVAALSDRARAERLHELLMPFAEHNAVHDLIRVTAGSMSTPLGVLARTLGRTEDALRHLDDAVAMDERMGARPCQMRALVERAHTLRLRDEPGDAEAAGRALADAQSLADALGVPVREPPGAPRPR